MQSHPKAQIFGPPQKSQNYILEREQHDMSFTCFIQFLYTLQNEFFGFLGTEEKTEFLCSK